MFASAIALLYMLLAMAFCFLRLRDDSLFRILSRLRLDIRRDVRCFFALGGVTSAVGAAGVWPGTCLCLIWWAFCVVPCFRRRFRLWGFCLCVVARAGGVRCLSALVSLGFSAYRCCWYPSRFFGQRGCPGGLNPAHAVEVYWTCGGSWIAVDVAASGRPCGPLLRQMS